ncbi:nicotinate-nucleotide--dimethylbenzimidazole phosphoribosyltransferase [Streptomyces klenkii]|uniref:Nicotinate-nucleotide--dimethylbenzimidazole phosphoribosyltransferase n=1 Tax=Streptomyces klenkii TaxID=1420899 RepID=A0A3B0AI95_9ACTN|nr:nicotinate-nucleotide--dimethylbenzimidazole phosphoribosyltransferase [Streptomyces klenkii]RKN60330.1 nicotinate-nucleotide--dimethylbenzimidazole phosphoribosyltransferase [Streptomyces klenkii]
MTDTGQFPGEGQPENAGALPGHPFPTDAAAPADPGAPAAFTFLDHGDAAEADGADEDDLLLMPGAQGAWMEQPAAQGGTHESGGRDTGSVDYGDVRTPPAPAAPAAPRRPLHMGPPVPDPTSGVVRSLADRGPAAPAPAPVRPPAPPAAPVPGPEYLDATTDETGTQQTPRLGEVPQQQPGTWDAQPQPPAAPAFVPPQAAGTAAPAAPAPVAGDVASAAPEAPAGATSTGLSAIDAVVAAATGQVHVPPSVSGVPAETAAPAAGVPVEAPQDGQVVAAAAGQEQQEQVVPAVVAAAPQTAVPTEPEPLPAAPQADQPVAAEAGAEAPADAAPQAEQAVAVAEAADTTPQAEQVAAAVAPVVASPAAEQVMDAAAAEAASAEQAAGVADVAAVAAPQGEQAADVAAAVAPAEQVADAAAAAVAAAPVVAPQAEQVIDAVAAAAVDAPAGVPAEQPAATVAAAAPQTDLPVVVEAAAPAGQTAGVVADATPQAEQAVDVVAAADAAVVAPAEQAEETIAAAVAPAGEAAGVVADAAPQAERAADVVAAEVTVVAPAEQVEETVAAAVAAPQADQPVVTEAGAAAAAPAGEAAGVVADAAPQAEQAVDVAVSDAGQPAAAAPDEQATDVASAVAPQPAVPAAETPAAPPAEAEPTAGVLADAGPVAPEAPAAAPEAPVSAPAPAPQVPADIPAVASEEASGQAAGVVADAPADTPSAPHAPGGVPQPEQATISEPQAPETEAVAHTPAADSEPRAVQPEQAAADLPEPAAGTGTSTGTDAQPVAEEVRIPAPHQSPDEPATDPVAVPAPRAAEAAAEPVAEPAAEAAAELAAENTPAGDDARDSVPAATGYGDAEREAVHRVMRERRDIRNGFRTDPIPHEVLLRVLEAAHTAPSVGHSQPWDFVVIRSAETRQAMHELAQRQRDAYAKSLPKGRAKQFKELKIEAILETPVNIVVTADPTRGGRHTLGRHTQPQMAPYSSALAVENLWLAARAEGLGVGWVSFFDEREMVRALGLPDHLEVVAYLCVGYVDEFPDEPELMQAGWSKRRPLSWVVHEEEYGRRALPGEDPHDLLAETLRGIRPLDAKALGEAWERQKRMTKPSGALGMLEIISAQLCGLSRKCPPPIPEPAAVAIFAGDHGVHAQGVTAWPQEVTSQMVANFLGGGAVCNAFANQVGAEVCVVDVGVAGELPSTPGLLPRKIRPGTADFTAGPAMTREEAMRALEVGIETARDLVAAGNKALLTGEMGIANTTASAALISVFTGADPAEITGRGTGINDEMHARKIDVVRRALELHQPDPKDPIGVLAAVGGLEHAALVGLILGGASLRTPVILDGVSAGAAALVARAIAPEALAACIAGHRSAEPGHVAALTKLGLRPLVDLDLRLGEGTGALLALPIVQSAARAMHEVATFDTAGVTEKA